jgi:serine/threonine-protein kinase
MLAEIIPPRKINPLIPEDLEIIVMKCLEKQPSLRYNDAKELAEDLKRFLEGEPIKARPHSWNYKIIKKVKKYKIPINLFLFAVIAFLIVLLLWHRSLQISQKQLQISMDFNQSIRYIEELLRHAYTSPLHDIRAEQKEVLIEIEKIKNQMLSIGEPANGPGNYAIGKAYLLLKDYENSKKYLELSKKSKYETPELFYALGQLYGTIYSNKVEDAEKIQDQQIKKAVIKELEKQFKIPAINYLSKSKNIKIESPEYIEGQIAFYEEKYDQAIEKLKLAYNKISWLYEAKRLEADIFVILGQNQQNKANYEQALKYYKQAESAYKEAIEIGRSDNTNYEGMCNLWNIRFRMEALDKGGMVEPNFSNAIKECDKALVAYPESTHAYKLKAILYNNLAEYEQFHGINPLPNIENALKNINTAIQIKPKDNALYNTLTFIYIKKANIEYEKGIDPTNTLNLAIQAAQKSFGLYPNDYITHNNVGIIYLLAAAHDLDSEKDPSGNINKSIEHFENAIKLENNFAYAYNNMGRSYWLLSKYLIKKNQDPSNSILKSIELYDTALKIQPNFLMALNNKGVSFFQYAEYQIKQGISPDASLDNAFLAFQQAQKINPNSPDILRKIAHTYLLKSEYYSIHGKNPIPLAQESIKLLTKAITLDANSANNYITLAESYKIIASYYLLNGENPLDAIENAKINYSKAIKLQPDNNITYANLIELLCLEIKYHLDNQSYPYNIIQYTIDIIEKTQNIDSSNFYTNLYSMIFYNLIADYEIENNLDPKHNIQKSEYILQKIKPTNPYDYNLLINEANLALLKIHWNLKMHLPYMNLIKNITSTLDKILSTNNNDINAHFLLCELNRHLAEYKVINNEMINNEIINAVSECDKVISLNQKHSYAIANKAILLLLKSRHELSNSKTEEAINQALTLFNKAIEINKNLPYKYKKHFELFKNDNYKNRALCN